jgi:4'-phosphopantetheinyl transferase
MLIVRLARPTPITDHLVEMLDPHERAALARRRRAADQRDYLTAHVLARVTLGQHMELAPGSVAIDHGGIDPGSRRKPKLQGEGDIDFSLFHASGLCGCALSDRSVGLDGEPSAQAVHLVPIADQFLAPAEQQALSERPEQRCARILLRQWVRKEAIVKALGTGLSTPMAKISLSLERSGPSGFRASSELLPPGLTIVDLAVSTDHTVALATTRSPAELDLAWATELLTR